MANENESRQQVAAYQRLVQDYETIRAEIQALLAKDQGGTKNMTDADRDRYRLLARRRDELDNELRLLQQQLFVEED